ncbi:MAG: hypothetical protein QOG87_3822 [Actinomycetota bacterium]
MKHRSWHRSLSVLIGLLLLAGTVAAATVDPADPVPVAAGPRPTTTTSTTEAPTTTTEATTTTAAPVTAPPTTRKVAPRVVAPRPPTTKKPAPAPAPKPAAQPSGITAMFYYGWYPSAFQTMGSRFHPSAGEYSSQDPAVVRKHIDQMRYAGMQAGIASWWGAGHMTDKALAVGMAEAQGTPFKWTVYYELEGPTDPNPSVEKLRADLQYIRDKYTNNPNWLYVDGKPVIFVWPDGNDRCEMVDRWNAANTMGFYVVQKRFPNNAGCIGRTASWHDYSPDLYRIEVKGYSFSVGPGFHKFDENPRLARNQGQFDSATAAMAASSAPWKLVTTFNEWNEGTSVEPASEWASPSGYGVYLDILHKHLGSR